MTQDFMIRSGIQMSVVGADALLAALRQMQQETLQYGQITTQTATQMTNAWYAYASALRAQNLTQMQGPGVANAGAVATASMQASMNQINTIQDQTLDTMEQRWKEHAAQVTQTLTYLGVAFEAYGVKVGKMAIDTATLASRAEELDVVVRNMAEVLGYDVQAIKEYEESIKAMNVRTDAARQSLLLFMRMGIDVSKSVDLTRVAMDAAVIAAEDTSDALEAIMRGIMTLQPRVLRTHGIVVNLDMAYKDYTHTMGTTVESLTMEEKQEIALQEVLKQGLRLRGMYESAMTTASKQMRSLHREAYETTRELGEGLVPGLTAGVKAAKFFNDTIQAMPDALQGTISKMVAFSAVMATVAGTGMLLIPRLGQLRTALAAINAIRLTEAGAFMGLGGALVPVAAIGIAATVVAAIVSIREAQDKQAASTADTADSYAEYIVNMRLAKNEAVALTGALWDVIEAQRAMGEAPTGKEIADAMRGLTDYFGNIGAATREATEGMSGLLLAGLALSGNMILPKGEELVKLFQELANGTKNFSDLQLTFASDTAKVISVLEQQSWWEKLSLEDKQLLVGMIRNEVKAEIAHRKTLRDSEKAIKLYWDAYRGGIDLYTDAQKGAMALTDATEALTAALEHGIVSRYTDFLGGLADALGDIRGIDQDLADIRVENKKNIDKLGRDMSKSMKELTDQLAKLVPGATEDEARKQMAGNAWDEWARRWAAAQDEVMSAEEAGWLAHTQELVKGTKWMMLEGETTYEWLARLREGFYAGDKQLTDAFANQNTAAWAWMKIQNAEALKLKRDELALELGAKAAELAAEAALEKAALEEKRKWAMLELSLQLAGASGALDQWAKDYAKSVGASDLWAAFADPEQLYAFIKQGQIDPTKALGLDKLIDRYGIGLTGALNSTADAAANAVKWLDATNASWQTQAQATQATLDSYKAQLSKPWGEQLPYAATGLQGKQNLGPFGALAGGLQGFKDLAQDLIGTTFPAIANQNMITLEMMKRDWDDFEIYVYRVMYGHSVVPTLEQAMDDWAKATRDAVDLEIIPAIKRVIDELAKIPTEIRVNITVSYGGWTGGGAGGSLPPGSPPTGGAGGLVVPPGVGGLMVLPPLVGRGATRSSAPVMVSGDSFVINVNDPASMALAQMMVDDRKQQRRNTFMGA